jgi:hypothetical protein
MFFSQRPRTIRGSINHLYVNKYMYFPLQIHSCKTLSFHEKSNIKPYHKRVIHVFFQCPRTIRGFSNRSFASTELILDYIPVPLENNDTSTCSFYSFAHTLGYVVLENCQNYTEMYQCPPRAWYSKDFVQKDIHRLP